MARTEEGRIHGSLEWRKSTYSGPHGQCVELALDGAVVCVRDSKDPDGPVIRLARGGRAALSALMREAMLGLAGSMFTQN
ncbi:DUF397 domain-containing protein [Actinomadura rayongensis]|uniref:DUF397 domain-containing protein n=1 Tax=Actinomadura rayongensis TaxID=1429076 RepID=A0A6I4WG44_9ACTN|nr:DUF397 domain-containing protein [Actinomadura rayongensis]MXQ65964.1 DUF397 domain-containing protein [Actinomadura rayongensis]